MEVGKIIDIKWGGRLQILISGYYGFNNTGDEAVLAALISGLKNRLEGVKIIVLSAVPDRTKELHGVETVGRYDYINLVSLLRDCDLLISGGGSLLQDTTGWKTIPYYLSVILLADIFGVSVVCCGQGVGPIETGINRRLVGKVLNQVEKITVRDQNSAELLTELGVESEISVTADPVFTLTPPPPTETAKLLTQEGIKLKEPVIGAAVRNWDSNQYLKKLAELLDQLKIELDAQILLIPFQYPTDKKVSRKLKKFMAEETLIIKGDYNPKKILGLIGRLDLLIGLRLHSLIFAVQQGVLPAGISYDPKVDNFLTQFGLQPVGTTNNLQVNQVYRRIISLWSRREEIITGWEKKLETIEGLARQNLEVIEQLAREGR